MLGDCFLLFWKGNFSGKVTAIREAFDCRIVDEDLVHDNSDVNAYNNVQLIELDQTTEGKLEKIIKQLPPKTCCLDSTPTDLLKQSAAIHLPCRVNIVIVTVTYELPIYPILRMSITDPFARTLATIRVPD